MKVDGNWWKWMKVDENKCKWMKVDEKKWMKVDTMNGYWCQADELMSPDVEKAALLALSPLSIPSPLSTILQLLELVQNQLARVWPSIKRQLLQPRLDSLQHIYEERFIAQLLPLFSRRRWRPSLCACLVWTSPYSQFFPQWHWEIELKSLGMSFDSGPDSGKWLVSRNVFPSPAGSSLAPPPPRRRHFSRRQILFHGRCTPRSLHHLCDTFASEPPTVFIRNRFPPAFDAPAPWGLWLRCNSANREENPGLVTIPLLLPAHGGQPPVQPRNTTRNPESRLSRLGTCSAFAGFLFDTCSACFSPHFWPSNIRTNDFKLADLIGLFRFKIYNPQESLRKHSTCGLILEMLVSTWSLTFTDSLYRLFGNF